MNSQFVRYGTVWQSCGRCPPCMVGQPERCAMQGYPFPVGPDPNTGLGALEALPGHVEAEERAATIVTIRRQLNALGGQYTNARLRLLRHPTSWERVAKRSEMLRKPGTEGGPRRSIFIVEREVDCYVVRLTNPPVRSALTHSGDLWFVSGPSVQVRTYEVELRDARSLDLLDLEQATEVRSRLGQFLEWAGLTL